MPPNYLQSIGGFGQPLDTPTFAQPQNITPSFDIAGFGQQQPQGAMGKIGDWLGKNGNLSTAFQGISALGSAYLGFQQMKLAKDNLKFQKQAYNQNLTNSTQSYNTNLTDRINGRTADYAGKQSDVAAYLAQNELKKPGG